VRGGFACRAHFALTSPRKIFPLALRGKIPHQEERLGVRLIHVFSNVLDDLFDMGLALALATSAQRR
jgi:hypothetical protein